MKILISYYSISHFLSQWKNIWVGLYQNITQASFSVKPIIAVMFSNNTGE